MNAAKQIAKRFREVYLDGKWVVATNLKAELSDLTWEQATTKIGSLNTIAALAFHLDYYIGGVTNVLEGGGLEIRDKYSFDMAPVTSQEDWDKLVHQVVSNAEKYAQLVEQLPDEKLASAFADAKYGSYELNLNVITEHSYYHLGQIVLIKKMLLSQ